MLTARDIRGLSVMAPTPCKEDAEGWDVPDSVDLEETATMVEHYIRAGVGSLALCGTTGECAALLWGEKRAFIDTAVQVTHKRVPVFAGCTALGTKEIIRQMRGMKDVGADGAFIGLPLWQTPTIENAVRFYADLSDAGPDMPILVYANAMFFKSTFPTAFWEGVGKRAPTVVTCKISYSINNLLDDLRVAGHQINFMPGEGAIYQAYKMAGDRITAVWSSGSAGMGPEPMVALAEAILNNDDKRVDEIWEDIRSQPAGSPPGEFAEGFPKYNAQQNAWAANAAGFVRRGPTRTPYRLSDLPESWKRAAENRAKAWTELRKKYVKAPAS